MKRSTKIITATLLTIGVATGAAAYGKHKFGNHEARAEHMVGYISDKLELDSTQTQALDVLKDQMLSTASTMKSEFSPIRDEVRSLVAAETFDQAKALELVNARAAAITAAAPEVVTAMANFLDGLDAEQKAEVLEFMDKRGKHGKRHHRGGWGHGDNDE